MGDEVVDGVGRVAEPVDHLVHRVPAVEPGLRAGVDGPLDGQLPVPHQRPVRGLLAGPAHQHEHPARTKDVQAQVDRAGLTHAVEHGVDAPLEDRQRRHHRTQHPTAVRGGERLDGGTAGGQRARGTGPSGHARAVLAGADHGDVEVGVQHPQGGRDEQADRPWPDDDHPVAAAVPLQGRVQGDRGRLGENGPSRRQVPHRAKLRLVRHEHLTPAAAQSGVEPVGRRLHPGDTWFVEPLARVGQTPSAARAALVEPTVRAGEHRVQHHSVTLAEAAHPGPDRVHHAHDLVAQDGLRRDVEGREHQRDLRVRQRHVGAADARQLRPHPHPPVGLRQARRGQVVPQSQQPPTAPARVILDPRGEGGGHVPRWRDLGQHSTHVRSAPRCSPSPGSAPWPARTPPAGSSRAHGEPSRSSSHPGGTA